MWYTIGMIALKGLYWAFRGTLKKAIDDPKRDWDEKMMEAGDLIFGRETPTAE
ncbi:MAG: hypothetical protein JRD68_15215 [Deltaproteobacteria bacterium]|nr:hypothetical protein [Deltaproteobacteria bacterium]